MADSALAELEPRPGVAKPDALLKAEGVRRQFGGLVAVDVEKLEVQRGAITALIGPNGAGKSTFFNVLSGFDRPPAGSWSFDGTAINGWRAHRIARRGMVRTFQLTKALARLIGARQHDAGRVRTRSGERLVAGAVARPVALAGAQTSSCRRSSCSSGFKLIDHARRLRRHAFGRPAKAARDGPRADGLARR